MIIRKIYTITILLGIAIVAHSQNISKIDVSDSILACKIINSHLQNPADAGKLLKGMPYVAHTLEGNEPERLVINLHELDCTTFVENAIALYLSRGKTFNDYKTLLQKLRYFNNDVSYTTRKHYITSWICDNEANGYISDVTATNGTATLTTYLNYMSTHPYKYSFLIKHRDSISNISKTEKKYSGITVKYLPKSAINEGSTSWIKEGDIVILLSNIHGLDAAHLGIAVYTDGSLHLMHASSVGHRVIIDARPLKEQVNNPMYKGIRVLRVKG